MKYFKIILLSILIIPLKVLAYSDYIIPGGETIGIKIESDGILVTGFYKIDNKYNKGTPSIKQGDYIIKVNNHEVNTIDELTHEIENSTNKDYINLTVRRNNEEKNINLNLIYEDNIYKTGLYVKDSITGIGTLSYIDPATKIFGSLGHEIIDSQTNSLVEIKTGSIFENYITSINKSTIGSAGSKNAKFYYNTKYGRIIKNTNVGIYGIYEANIPDKELMKVASSKEVTLGNAQIATVINEETIEYFDINIISIDESAHIKNITFEITDEDLIEASGGIVQGMSGSPIIQDDKIIGVVTHVIVDSPTKGYAIFITTMLEEGEKE